MTLEVKIEDEQGRLERFVDTDASFDNDGEVVEQRKRKNIELAVMLLFGASLATLFPGSSDTKLSHRIHAIIAANGLIEGGGKVLDSSDDSLSTSKGHRHENLSETDVNRQLDELFSLCNSLIEQRQSLSKEEKFRVAAYFLFKYLAIHPYSDGNGRTARLLTSLLLMHLGATAWPVCFNLRPENREDYIAGLNPAGDVTGPNSEQLVPLTRLLMKAEKETRDEFSRSDSRTYSRASGHCGSTDREC